MAEVLSMPSRLSLCLPVLQGGEGIAVGAEVCDEVGGDFVGDEFVAEHGFGGEFTDDGEPRHSCRGPMG